VSSLQSSSGPSVQPAARTYRTVSKVVALPLQVSMVAVPVVAGVHWKTASGAPLVGPGTHVPVRALAPLVEPVTTPPAGGMTVGLVQSAATPAAAKTVVQATAAMLPNNPRIVIVVSPSTSITTAPSRPTPNLERQR
jgi:hypothetical protein